MTDGLPQSSSWHVGVVVETVLASHKLVRNSKSWKMTSSRQQRYLDKGDWS